MDINFTGPTKCQSFKKPSASKLPVGTGIILPATRIHTRKKCILKELPNSSETEDIRKIR